MLACEIARQLFWKEMRDAAPGAFDCRGHQGELGSGNQSQQQVPVAPDPGTDDARHITEVGKHLIGFGRFETKLNFPLHRYEALLECRRESTLIEIDEPECDCRSDQSHNRS